MMATDIPPTFLVNATGSQMVSPQMTKVAEVSNTATNDNKLIGIGKPITCPII